MAAAKPVRNLAILFSDVGPYRSRRPSSTWSTTTPFGWENHCGDIIRNGGPLESHLLSANLDFSGGTSDPASPTRGENAWGLTHALAALARRRPMTATATISAGVGAAFIDEHQPGRERRRPSNLRPSAVAGRPAPTKRRPTRKPWRNACGENTGKTRPGALAESGGMEQSQPARHVQGRPAQPAVGGKRHPGRDQAASADLARTILAAVKRADLPYRPGCGAPAGNCDG